MPALAKDDGARLLWYTNHAVGSGVSYNVVTVTGVRDGAAWERLARRIQSGDLQAWMRDVDALRHDVNGKLLLALPWSPMQDVDLASVPTGGAEHGLTMYMEDTMWPIEGKYPDYVRASGEVYAKSLEHVGTNQHIRDLRARIDQPEQLSVLLVQCHEKLFRQLGHNSTSWQILPVYRIS